VGKSATLLKLYCEWNELVGRNSWVWELTSFGMRRLSRKRPAPRGAGFLNSERLCPLFLSSVAGRGYVGFVLEGKPAFERGVPWSSEIVDEH
jgi:hypothetical protein